MLKKIAILFILPLLYSSTTAQTGRKLPYEQIIKILPTDSLLTVPAYVKNQLYKFITIALTREVERGTMETLLATPVRPVEVMIGKTTPYIIVGAIQVALVLVAARVLFHVPFTGSWPAFFTGVTIFLFANLMLGYLISTAARTQMQAMQMTFFIFLPSILLSGFMFPFRAMPPWARDIGEILPLTHFLRLVRKVVLKGGDFAAVLNDLAPLAAILAVLTTLALVRFRRTLD